MLSRFKKAILILVIMCIPMNVGCETISENLVEDYEGYYNLVKEGLSNYENEIVVNVKNYDEDVYNADVINNVLEDNLWLAGNFDNTKVQVKKLNSYAKIILEPEYYESKDTLVSKDNEVNNKVEEIVSKVITPEMKNYEKERALHDYLVNNTSYDERLNLGNMPRESYTAYGALIEGTAVCQGYAVAMDKLLKAVGLETMIVIGEALNDEGYISHAWNLVKFEDDYYHLDPTWNDPIMEDGSDKIRYSYFNITDEEIKITHKWDESNYPKATKKEYSFDNLNLTEKDLDGNNVVVAMDNNEFSNYLREDFLSNIEGKTYKILNFNGDEKDIEDSVQQAFTIESIVNECSYTIEFDDIRKVAYVSLKFN